MDIMGKNRSTSLECAFKHLNKAAHDAELSFKEFSMVLERIKEAGRRGAKVGTELRSKINKH